MQTAIRKTDADPAPAKRLTGNAPGIRVPPEILGHVPPGDIIPADVKLLTEALTVDQSALTGESKDADKASGEVRSSGAVVRRG